MCDYITNDTI